MGPVGQDVGDTWECNFNAFEIALDSSLTRVNSHLIRKVRVGRESSFQAGLEFGPVSPQIRAVWWAEKG